MLWGETEGVCERDLQPTGTLKCIGLGEGDGEGEGESTDREGRV